MTVNTSSLWEAARGYVAASLSVIPIDARPTKKPAYNLLPVTGAWPDGRPRRGWKPFEARHPTEEELQKWFNSWGCCCGIAVVCGAVSGGVELLDIDSEEYVVPWLEQVQLRATGLIDRLVLVRTPRPGLHVYYRCSSIGRNEKLAKKIIVDQATAHCETKTIIETRGEGGYALIPPTPGHCHPTGRVYEYCTSRTLVDVQEISVQERDLLFEVARSFDAMPRRQSAPPRPATPQRPADPRKPDDDFNARADWTELLERHGWSFSHLDPDGKEHWTRPGKAEGTSATLNFEGNGLFHVFSSNAEPLEQDRSYTKFHFLVVMECQGDFSRAMRVLAGRGFGQQSLGVGPRLRPSNSGKISSSRRRHSRRR